MVRQSVTGFSEEDFYHRGERYYIINIVRTLKDAKQESAKWRKLGHKSHYIKRKGVFGTNGIRWVVLRNKY